MVSNTGAVVLLKLLVSVSTILEAGSEEFIFVVQLLGTFFLFLLKIIYFILNNIKSSKLNIYLNKCLIKQDNLLIRARKRMTIKTSSIKKKPTSFNTEILVFDKTFFSYKSSNPFSSSSYGSVMFIGLDDIFEVRCFTKFLYFTNR